MFEKIPLSGADNTGWLRLRKSGIGGSDAEIGRASCRERV